MEVEVGRLAIRCRGGGADGGRALAARRRLEQVARGPLPAAIGRVVGDLDGTIDRLEVQLDLDPLAYDDETLATLWADRIRIALVTAIERMPPPTAPDGSGPVVTRRGVVDGAVVASWGGNRSFAAARDVVRGIEAASPVALAELARLVLARGPGLLLRLWRALPAADRARVLDRLEAVVGAGRGGTARPGLPEAPSRRARRGEGGAGPAAAVTKPAWEAAWRAAAAASPAAPAAAVTGDTPLDLLEASEAVVAASHVPAGSATRSGFASAAGGLVLLYPWLGGFLTRATQGLGELHEDDARRLALALLVHSCHADGCDTCEDGREVQHDPLVRVLAGAAPDADTLRLDAPPGLAAVAVEADALLRTFAGALPGFERSTPAYLRANLIRRPAVVEHLDGAVYVGLAPAPLDVLVARLPYPLGTFALSWTPTLHVRLEAA